MKVADVLRGYEGAVCVVHFLAVTLPEFQGEVYHGGGPVQNPACLLQVTLLQGKVSGSGKLIRFGETRGDEILGWTRLEALEVVEVLGVLGADGVTVTPVPRETLVLDAA